MHALDYTIRTMTRDEIGIAIDWAAAEGWNPGWYDADCYRAADPNGFLIGLLGDEPVATISVVKYDATFGFLGFYIVKPEYRGQGYGLPIWQAGMDYLDGCNIGLDGVVAQQDNYRKSGFRLAYRNIRYEGRSGGEPPVALGAGEDIVTLAHLPFEDIAAYDLPFFPAPRPAFLRAWIDHPSHVALGIVQQGRLAGYGVLRRCRLGCKIGPLNADNPALARTLFGALKARAAPSESVFLDVPEVNPAAVALAETHGMTAMFETARMYTGEPPKLALDRLYGVTSFEIG